MTISKHLNRTAVLIILSIFSATANSAGIVKNENKINGSGDIISNTDVTGSTDGNTDHNVEKPFYPNDENRRQAQLDAYKRLLENQKRFSNELNRRFQSGAQRNEVFLEQVEKRRLMIQKLIEERRNAARDKRNLMIQKQHQTSIPAAYADDFS